jgi:hypothetical protein
VAIAGLGVAVLAWLIWLCLAWAPEFDEYATLWFSDPSVGLGALYRERWASETNPPLYYLLIWAIRSLNETSIEMLRMVHVPVFAAVAAYLLACMRACPARRFYFASMAVLYVSSGVCFQFFPYLRAYFLLFSAALAACAAMVLSLEPGEGRRTLHRVVLAVALFLLMNLHFTGALFGGIWVACELVLAVLRRRWNLARFLLAAGAFAALPATLFVAVNLGALSGRAEHFWITTTTPEALGRMAIVVRGSVARNVAVLLATAMTLAAVLRRRTAGAALHPHGALGAAAADGVAALLFFLVIGAANAYHPIIIVRYLLVASAPLMSMLSLAAERSLLRHGYLMLAVIANGAAVVLLALLHPPEARPQAGADRAIIGRLAQRCPSARIYGLYQERDGSDLYRTMYAMDARLSGFAVQPQLTAAPWTPLLDPACPTVLWAAHARGRDEIQRPEDFVASFNLELDPVVAQKARLRITPSTGLLLLLPPSG